MSLKTFVDRLQMAALVLAALFVLFLFVGWPGAGDGASSPGNGPDTSEAPSTSEAPDTSEAPSTSEAPDKSEAPVTSEG